MIRTLAFTLQPTIQVLKQSGTGLKNALSVRGDNGARIRLEAGILGSHQIITFLSVYPRL